MDEQQVTDTVVVIVTTAINSPQATMEIEANATATRAIAAIWKTVVALAQ